MQMGSRPKYRVHLKEKDRQALKVMMSKGRQPVRVLKRARVLQVMDAGVSAEVAGKAIGLSDGAARRVAKRYLEGGLASSLYERPRPGQERRLSKRQETQVVAMVCAGPPEGYAKWSVRLIAKEVVGRQIATKVGRETIRVLLRGHDLKPWREKNVVRTRPEPRVRRTHGGSAESV